MADSTEALDQSSAGDASQKIVKPLGTTFEKDLSQMSPFELKNLLVEYAKEDHKKAAVAFLNAGRGNPNWVCTLPRKAFFLLGQFAVEEAERTMYNPDFDVAGLPHRAGSAERFLSYLSTKAEQREARFLVDCFDYLTKKGMDGDSLVQEWTEGIVGCEYPMPERILVHTQDIIRMYLDMVLNAGQTPDVPFDLFATEGGTAAMCYLFYSLKCNFLVNPGDTIALMTPIFTPYIEIPELNDYDLNVVHVKASTMSADGLHTWQFPDEEIEKLKDPKIRLLCLVNPSNPPSYAMDDSSVAKLVEVVKNDNPDLIIITDDVYGTFVEGYHSLIHDLPYNTASVYSFSKYFGATGWRLAAISVAHDNLFDNLIGRLDDKKKAVLAERYSSLGDDVPSIRFIDRMVADSRLVALNGTAGLSTPQQVQMSLFALYCLLDDMGIYPTKMREMIKDRFDYLWDALRFEEPTDKERASYYSIIDLEIWSRRLFGDDFFEWLDQKFLPLDIVIRLAQDTGVVVLNGDGFDASRWSIRVSLANLGIDDFVAVGRRIREMLDEYHAGWASEQKK